MLCIVLMATTFQVCSRNSSSRWIAMDEPDSGKSINFDAYRTVTDMMRHGEAGCDFLSRAHSQVWMWWAFVQECPNFMFLCLLFALILLKRNRNDWSGYCWNNAIKTVWVIFGRSVYFWNQFDSLAKRWTRSGRTSCEMHCGNSRSYLHQLMTWKIVEIWLVLGRLSNPSFPDWVLLLMPYGFNSLQYIWMT